MRPQPWHDEAMAMFQAHMSIREIAHTLGRDRSSVRYILQTRGLYEKRQPHAAEWHEEAARLHVEEGLSPSRIARRLAQSLTAVSEALRRRGLASKRREPPALGEIERVYEACGYNAAEAARRLGYRRAETLREKLREAGLSVSDSPGPKGIVPAEEFARLLAEHKHQKIVAAKLGVCRQTVNARARRLRKKGLLAA